MVHGELRSDGEALVALPSVGREGGAPPELFLWLEAADAKPMVALITSLSETVTTLHGRDVRARFHPTEGSALDGFVTFDAGPERAATAFIDRAEPHAGGVLFSLPEIPSSSTAAVTMVLTKSVEGSFALPENDMVWPSAPEGALPCDDPSIATSAVDKKCAIVTAACITIFAMIYQGCLQKCGSSPDPDGCKNDCDTAWGIKKWGLCGLIFYACKVLDRLGVGGDALHDGGVSSDEEAQSAPVLTTG